MKQINLKLYKIPALLFVLLIVISVFIINYTASNNKIHYNKFIIKNGLIVNPSDYDVFTGKIVDTVRNKIIEYEVVGGRKNGEFAIRYMNGNFQIKGNMKNNKNSGEWKYFYPSGQLESVGKFKNDVVSDEWVWFYENGKRKENGVFINGERDGRWNMYDKNGNLKTILYFNHGKMITKLDAQESKSI
jgi:antitoxin component YwqK of YwqJK toxin-antitoxin module